MHFLQSVCFVTKCFTFLLCLYFPLQIHVRVCLFHHKYFGVFFFFCLLLLRMFLQFSFHNNLFTFKHHRKGFLVCVCVCMCLLHNWFLYAAVAHFVDYYWSRLENNILFIFQHVAVAFFCFYFFFLLNHTSTLHNIFFLHFLLITITTFCPWNLSILRKKKNHSLFASFHHSNMVFGF